MAGVPGSDYAVNAESEDDDYDPSNYMTAGADLQSPASAIITPASEPPNPVTNGSAQPSVDSPQGHQHSARTNGTVKQPRTVGGFVVDDDDDEEDADESMDELNGSLSAADATQVAQAAADNTLPTSEQSMSEQATQDSGAAVTSAHSTVVAPTQPLSTSSLHSPVAASNPRGPSTPLKMTAESTAALSKARLPQDRVGILEDRIAEDPRGDVEAWLSLIAEHRSKNKINEARDIYERFFKVFPSAAEQWVEYAHMELELEKWYNVEQIFNRTLMSIPSVQLWSVYLDYIRRRNNLITDTTGNARKTITQAYDFVLQNIGIDKEAGFIWQDYLKFLKSGPGTPGGSSWQDGQKMDSLRKAYQNAIRIPTQALNHLWSEYNTFETTLNKTTGRQILNQQSPYFMTAKQQYVALNTILSKLNRTTIPRLPPLPGYAGNEEFEEQLTLWKKWIKWERDDPLVLRDSDKKEEKEEYKKRVIYAYKHALMALRFVPEIWWDAADFCFANGMEKEGDEFLAKGIEANPESCLLAFKRGDRIEMATIGESDPAKRVLAVRVPYDTLLDALYDLVSKLIARGEKEVAEIKASFAEDQQNVTPKDEDDEEDEIETTAAKQRREAMEARVAVAEKDSNDQIMALRKTLTEVWIALLRVVRRIQGKGRSGGDEPTGMRGLFTEARKRGRLVSSFYIAAGALEHYSYQDPAGTKILERGMKLFPEDEDIALAYIKHLIEKHDDTNARAIFEAIVGKLSSKPETLPKAKPLFLYFYGYEARFGELSQIQKLETRIAALYPDDPKLELFAQRYQSTDAHNVLFDPIATQHVISPATQTKPKSKQIGTTLPSIEAPVEKSPAPETASYSNSPKRPFLPDESDNELYPPRKLQRGESPLKGAAGRRLAAAGRIASPAPAPFTIPAAVNFALRVLPNAHSSQQLLSRVQRDKLIGIMRGVDTSRPPPATLNIQPPLHVASVQPPLQSPQQRIGSGTWPQQPPPAPNPPTSYGQPYAMAPPVPPSQPPTAANSYGVSPPLPVQTGQYGAPQQAPPSVPPPAYPGYPVSGQQQQYGYPPPPQQHGWPQQGSPSASVYGGQQGYQGYR